MNTDSPLALDAETMRRLGYRTVDMLVDRLLAPPGPVVRAATPQELRERLKVPPPESPAGFDEILDGLERDVLPYVARISHPGYLAFGPGEGTWPGALGDLIASALNVDTCWWLGASGPSALELVVLDWFREWVGYPEHAAGVLVSGGSAANLTALACARESRVGAMDDHAVVYMSDQTHSSLARAARALGFRPDQVRVIPTDERARIRPEAVAAAIAADRTARRRPLVLIANAGTTAAGAVDDFEALAAAICRQNDVWLHVDGAYGAFACLSARGKQALAGMELADSITLDPHKWLYQPVELGALLVREGALLRRGFEINPDYLTDIEAADQEVNFSDLGLQLTRSCRALKLWMSLRYFGVGAFREAIDRCMDLALHAEQRIEAAPELELMSPASLGIVTFRRRPPEVDDEVRLERINARLADEIERQGDVFISTGRVRGRFVLRLCILNHSTSQAEVDRALELAVTLPFDPDASPAAPRESYPAIEQGWLGRSGLDGDALRALDLFSSLDEAQAERVLLTAREHDAVPGEVIIEQWEVSRDLYVILDGAVEITAGEKRVSMCGAGEFFGELAAIDWGAGFARTRTATVTATEPTQLLVLDWVLVNWLMKAEPGFGGRLERASRERLATL